jgi:proteic killer suppression protein
MEIVSIRHKALRRFVQQGVTRGLIEPQRIADMIGLLRFAGSFDELAFPPNYGFHPMTGDRKGAFAMVITRNWRLTFTKVDERTIADLDLEDYH